MPKTTAPNRLLFSAATALAATLAAAPFIIADNAAAQNADNSAKKPAAMPVGDEARGEEHFEATCAECHGAAETAPTLRGIINRPIASIESFSGYSEALKSLSSKKWTVENLNAYIKNPDAFAPGNLMYRDYPDDQMRADVIAFLATLPPPKN